jgi:hypothetical protein
VTADALVEAAAKWLHEHHVDATFRDWENQPYTYREPEGDRL